MFTAMFKRGHRNRKPRHSMPTEKTPATYLTTIEGPMLDEASMDALFGDLPRQKNPQGIDDTDIIRQRIVRALPELAYYPDQSSHRRKLYMAILALRTNSKVGWRGDAWTRVPAAA